MHSGTKGLKPVFLAIIVTLICLVGFPGDSGAVASLQTCTFTNFTNLSTLDACIGAGKSCNITNNVVVDQDFDRRNGKPLGTLTIQSGGFLAFPNHNRDVDIAQIVVNGGTLQIGSESCQISPPNHVQLNFYGSPANVSECKNISGDSAKPTNKGICFKSGTLKLVGSRGVGDPNKPDRTWKHLLCPAGPRQYTKSGDSGVKAPVQGSTGLCPGSDLTVTLAGSVDWAQGDWIAVATTDFADDNTELVRILNTRPV